MIWAMTNGEHMLWGHRLTPKVAMMLSQERPSLHSILYAVITVLTLAIALAAQPAPCTSCIGGICYSPPPEPIMGSTTTVHWIGGQTIPVTTPVQLMESQGYPYPPSLVWRAMTCPYPIPIRLYGAIGWGTPGQPLPTPTPSTGPPGTPANPPSGSWPPAVFWCHSNALCPWGPALNPYSGGAPLPPPATSPSSTPPTRSPPPSYGGAVPSPPAPVPPVVFGPNGEGAATILLYSGCYTEIPCGGEPG